VSLANPSPPPYLTAAASEPLMKKGSYKSWLFKLKIECKFRNWLSTNQRINNYTNKVIRFFKFLISIGANTNPKRRWPQLLN
jgi:hypothetical protein